MTTLQTQITGLAQAVGADVKDINTKIGSMSGFAGLVALPGPVKASIYALINELVTRTDSSSNAIGAMSGLNTAAKTTLVAAINELKASIAAVDLTALIDDEGVTGDVDVTYSVDKILALFSALETKIMGGIAPETIDTIKELADYLTSNAVAGGIVEQLGKRVRVDAAQSFSAEQQAQARANIGGASQADLETTTQNAMDLFNQFNALVVNVLDPDVANHSYVTDYNTAKA